VKSAYYTDSDGKRVVFIGHLYDLKEELRLKRLRSVATVCGCLGFVFLTISILSSFVWEVT